MVPIPAPNTMQLYGHPFGLTFDFNEYHSTDESQSAILMDLSQCGFVKLAVERPV